MTGEPSYALVEDVETGQPPVLYPGDRLVIEGRAVVAPDGSCEVIPDAVSPTGEPVLKVRVIRGSN